MTAGPEDGLVEALPLAILTFVVGALVLAQAWGVVNARSEAVAAARAGARAYVESSPGEARGSAIRAARAVIAPGRRPAARWDIDVEGRPDRCRPVTVRVTTSVPLLRLPWIGSAAPIGVTGVHRELVDPFRAGLAGLAQCHG